MDEVIYLLLFPLGIRDISLDKFANFNKVDDARYGDFNAEYEAWCKLFDGILSGIVVLVVKLLFPDPFEADGASARSFLCTILS
jgi:hypothetical protein